MLRPSGGEKCGLGVCPTERKMTIVATISCVRITQFVYMWYRKLSVAQTPSAGLARLASGIAVLLAAILIPFFLYEEPISAWSQDFLDREESRWLVSAVLGGLLTADLVLPIPSSVLSTAAGYLLGLWAGSFVTWAGMTLGCLIGYGLGVTAGRKLTRRFVGDDELERASLARNRLGDWMIVIFRAVPVLAEASVLFAGIAGMPIRRFLLLASLSNLGIALAYAAVGAYALEVESFLLAFGGAVVLPGVAMMVARFRT